MTRPLIVLCLLATATNAQVIPTGSPAADILLFQAIAEHRVFLTCSALDPALNQQILTDWRADTDAAMTLLTAHKVALEAIGAFTNAADPRSLLPPDDTPWADVWELCAARPDWRKAYDTDRIILARTLPKALQ
jgi:hypothetical protein